MRTSPFIVEAQEGSTCSKENHFIALPFPLRQDSPATTTQAGCPCFPWNAEDTLILSASQPICLSDGAVIRPSARGATGPGRQETPEAGGCEPGCRAVEHADGGAASGECAG